MGCVGALLPVVRCVCYVVAWTFTMGPLLEVCGCVWVRVGGREGWCVCWCVALLPVVGCMGVCG